MSEREKQTDPGQARPGRTDMLIAALLFLAAALGTWAYITGYAFLPDVKYGDGDMFRPAISIATGHGLRTIEPVDPAIEDFIAKRTLTLDTSGLIDPSIFVVDPGGKFTLDRIYLLYAIAFVWRLLGISWSHVYLLNYGIAGLCAVILYAIFRLGMRSWIATLATLLTLCSPVVLLVLPAVRDFYKAPFILAAILFCGLTIRGHLRGGRLLGASLLCGAFIGIGIGFRQDSVICLPILLACILVFHQYSRPAMRLAAAALLLAGFLPFAWPVYRMNVDTGGNNAFYLNQGFASGSLEELNLEPASYAPSYTFSDYIMHAHIYCYGKHSGFNFMQQLGAYQAASFARGIAVSPVMPLHPGLFLADNFPVNVLPIWSKGAEMIARQRFTGLVAMLPADVLTRAYGAVLAVVRGEKERNVVDGAQNATMRFLRAVRHPLEIHLYQFAPLYFGLAFALMAAADWWMAFGALVVVLYFLGYPSLEFQLRHVFHLSFACWWFPGFLADQALRWREGRNRAPAGDAGLLPRTGWHPLLRAAVFLGTIFLLMALPLWIARAVQTRQLAGLTQAYYDAELEPVPVNEAGTDGLIHTLEVPTGNLFQELRGDSLLGTLLHVSTSPDVADEYLAADVEVSDPGAVVKFEYADAKGNFEGWTQAPGGSADAPREFRLFFPVFKFSDAFIRGNDATLFSDFRAIALQGGVTLKNLYRVKNKDDFRYLMVVWLPKNPADFRTAWRLRPWPWQTLRGF